MFLATWSNLPNKICGDIARVQAREWGGEAREVFSTLIFVCSHKPLSPGCKKTLTSADELAGMTPELGRTR